jgi:coniferyl-aldehyde dehydrogenase
VTTIINDAGYRRVTGLIDDARAKGAQIITIAPDSERDRLPAPATRRIPPTIVLDVTDDMAIAHEEVFGPVISVLPYDDLAEAIAYVNARPHPLTAYWYGSDGPGFQEFVRLTTSGGVMRNDMALYLGIKGVPFGGIGQSGMGAYHGRAGFDTFTHRRAITSNETGFGVAPTMIPPFSEAALDDLRQTIKTARSALPMPTATTDLMDRG